MAKIQAQSSKGARRPKSKREEAIEAVHRLKADRDEVAFEKRLKRIAKAKPKRPAKKRTHK